MTMNQQYATDTATATYLDDLTDTDLRYATDLKQINYLSADPEHPDTNWIELELDLLYKEMHKRGIYPVDGDIGK